MKEKIKNSKGITLIALIITIIILVILAAVSIRAVTNMGIVGHAINGTQEYAREAKAENEMLDTTGDTIDSALARLKEIQGGSGNAGGTGSSGSGNTGVTLTAGQTSPATGGTYQNVPIPAGFTVSGVSGEATSVDDGIVVYDLKGADATVTNFWTADTNSNNIPDVQENYNQFVWVPVTTPYVTAASLQTIITNSNGDITDETGALQSLVNGATSQYPMAVQYTGTIGGQSATCYRGVLYDFSEGTNGVEMTVKDFSSTADYVDGSADNSFTDYYREPAYLSDYDGSASDYKTGLTITQDILQSEYNAMVEKVAASGGFYVARYELSYNSTNNKGESKRAKTVSTAYDAATEYWYGLYSACQGMYNQSTDTVQSMMITGAQYDQIMIWMRNETNPNVSGEYYILDSTGMGWYSDVSSYEVTTTGSNNAYAVKKVFDLAGNVYEWTSEAYPASSRAGRGCTYYRNGSDYPAFYRGDDSPYSDNYVFSSRSTIYVK